MLMGIVTKNSILLVEFANESNEGVSRKDSLLRSGAERARPIIMTTIAMAAGMVPRGSQQWCRQRLSGADGDCCDWGADHVDCPESGIRSGGVHLYGRLANVSRTKINPIDLGHRDGSQGR